MDQLAGRSFHLPNSPASIVSMDIVDPTPRSWNAHALGFPDFPLSLRGIVARIRVDLAKASLGYLFQGIGRFWIHTIYWKDGGAAYDSKLLYGRCCGEY